MRPLVPCVHRSEVIGKRGAVLFRRAFGSFLDQRTDAPARLTHRALDVEAAQRDGVKDGVTRSWLCWLLRWCGDPRAIRYRLRDGGVSVVGGIGLSRVVGLERPDGLPRRGFNVERFRRCGFLGISDNL